MILPAFLTSPELSLYVFYQIPKKHSADPAVPLIRSAARRISLYISAEPS
jgi:hypothetical protein